MLSLLYKQTEDIAMTIQATIIKQTEKALNVKFAYNDNNDTKRISFSWIPKSVVESIDGELVEIKDWFANKLAQSLKDEGRVARIFGAEKIFAI